MFLSASSVIGANFGDEGKGLTVDWLTKQQTNCIVVKVNGGAQAGHTVETVDGKRHVFHQLGSGSFNNCPTYLAKTFLVHMHQLFDEIDEFSRIHPKHEVYVDSQAIVCVPLDEILNQAFEDARSNKHGSCGLGINETVERSGYPEYTITVLDLFNAINDTTELKQKFRKIQQIYVPQRINDMLSVSNGTLRVDELYETLNDNEYDNDDWFDLFWNSVIERLPEINLITDPVAQLSSKYPNVVFEHSQGLLLDQNNTEFFPHLTRSNTGLKNARLLAKEWGIPTIEPWYVTRWYLTRHGAGPLPFDYNDPEFNTKDMTNIPNKYQGIMRYAPLNLLLLRTAIYNDVRCQGNHNFNLMVTCMDQSDPNDNSILYVGMDNERHNCHITDLEYWLTTTLRPAKIMYSYSAQGSRIIPTIEC